MSDFQIRVFGVVAQLNDMQMGSAARYKQQAVILHFCPDSVGKRKGEKFMR